VLILASLFCLCYCRNKPKASDIESRAKSGNMELLMTGAQAAHPAMWTGPSTYPTYAPINTPTAAGAHVHYDYSGGPRYATGRRSAPTTTGDGYGPR